MTTYTTRPSQAWDGSIDILKDGQLCASVPAGTEQAQIDHMRETSRQHFQRIADLLDALDPRLVIASGHAYSIGNFNDDPKGYGGAQWLIHFFDGRLITTNSLWHMGEIPGEWRGRILSNATLRGFERTHHD